MKVSPSIYSSALSVLDTVKQIRNTIAEYIHVDINDKKNILSVKDDIDVIRTNCDLLIDVHLITKSPKDKLQTLLNIAPDLIAIQYENLDSPADFYCVREAFPCVGISITKQTEYHLVDKMIKDSDYVLLMTTVPGESGKSFDQESINWIKDFKEKYPNKKVHVDGGVNNIVADKIRDLKIDCIVSGSYLMCASSMVASVLKLKGIKGESKLRHYMTKINYIPILSPTETILDAFKSIELSQRGFCVVENKSRWGILTDGDIRRYIIKNCQKEIDVSSEIGSIVNYSPFHIDADCDVESLLRKLVEELFYKRLNFVVLTKYNSPVGILLLSKLYRGFQ